MIIFYTDGSAHPNPGPGGYGVIEIYKDDKTGEEFYQNEWSKYFDETTNNQMELSAINFVMQKFGHNMFDMWGQPPIVYSDSAYAVNTFNDWMFKWADNEWIKSDKKAPENLDIIKEYYNKYCAGYRIILKKIPGHAGNKWNEMADKLAKGSKILPII